MQQADVTADLKGPSGTGVISVNVGGIVYTTTQSTLRRSPFFQAMLDHTSDHATIQINTTRDTEGRLFVDRDGELFAGVLTVFRTNRVPARYDFRTCQQLIEELAFYGLQFTLDGLLVQWGTGTGVMSLECIASPEVLMQLAPSFVDPCLDAKIQERRSSASKGTGKGLAGVHQGGHPMLQGDATPPPGGPGGLDPFEGGGFPIFPFDTAQESLQELEEAKEKLQKQTQVTETQFKLHHNRLVSFGSLSRGSMNRGFGAITATNLDGFLYALEVELSRLGFQAVGETTDGFESDVKQRRFFRLAGNNQPGHD